MSFNTSFVQAFNPAFQQSGQAVIDLQRQKMQEAIQEESRKRALQDQIDQGLLAKWQEAYSTTPPPMVTGTDGNQSLNRASMRGLLSEYEAKKRDSDYARQLSIQSQAKLDADGAKLGVVKEAAPSWKQGDGSLLNQMKAQGVTADTFAQRVAGAEKQDKVQQAAAESKARAEASDPYESNYTGNTAFAVNGKYIGTAVRNVKTGEYGIKNGNGAISPIPDGAVPITPTALNKNIVSSNDFKKFKTDLTDSERSLRQFERYATSVGGLNQGVASLADKVVSGFKTLFNSGSLKPEELSRAAASGQLQGLLGGNRVSVVGGGVLTEQDAERIIKRLGGDVGALQNREVVMKAISELYQDRYAQYQDDVKFYNEAVGSYWGEQGFEKATPTNFNSLFGQPAINGNVPQSAQGTTQDATNPFSNMSDDELEKRKAELRAKNK